MNTPNPSAPQPDETNLPPEPETTVYPIAPLPNYTLATVCPACDAATFRHACKVRCPRCGFMWDCGEL